MELHLGSGEGPRPRPGGATAPFDRRWPHIDAAGGRKKDKKSLARNLATKWVRTVRARAGRRTELHHVGRAAQHEARGDYTSRGPSGNTFSAHEGAAKVMTVTLRNWLTLTHPTENQELTDVPTKRGRAEGKDGAPESAGTRPRCAREEGQPQRRWKGEERADASPLEHPFPPVGLASR